MKYRIIKEGSAYYLEEFTDLYFFKYWKRAQEEEILINGIFSTIDNLCDSLCKLYK